MATSSKADISKTENFFRALYYVSEIYVKFGVFWKKKDQSLSLSITENINCETGSYLNVQKAIFHAALWQITC